MDEVTLVRELDAASSIVSVADVVVGGRLGAASTQNATPTSPIRSGRSTSISMEEPPSITLAQEAHMPGRQM